MSKVKLYELHHMLNAKFETVFKGVRITLNFKAGFGIGGQKIGQLITQNEFVQDAIEADPRFGKTFYLKREFSTDQEDEDSYELRQAPPARTANKKTNAEIYAENQAKIAAKKKAAAKKPATQATAVDTVRNINDAIEYFAQRGETFADQEELDKLCKKHAVTFPNLQ